MSSDNSYCLEYLEYIYVDVLGVSMKEVQEWPDHSDYAIIANIYSHLEYNSKVSSAQVMSGVLKLK